jgi:hypothetical protein
MTQVIAAQQPSKRNKELGSLKILGETSSIRSWKHISIFWVAPKHPI